MNLQPIRYRGREYPVIDQFRIGGRLYKALSRLTSTSRLAYRVFDTSTKQMRALHVFPDNRGTIERLRVLQRVTRGNNEILQLLEWHQEQGQVWAVLPWIDGFDLRTVLRGIRERGKRRIAAPEAVRLLKGLAHALRRLYKRQQVVHGDIKPSNIILGKSTGLVLVDYGNAWSMESATERDAGDGVSSAYSAPEYLRGDPSVDYRADFFSLGVVLYEILTDQIPYEGYGGKVGLLSETAKSGSRLVPVSRISPERDQLSDRIWKPIDELLNRSLAIDANDRFQTTGDWIEAWDAAMLEIRKTSKEHQQSFATLLYRWLEEKIKR